jgi:hypothetical protein
MRKRGTRYDTHISKDPVPKTRRYSAEPANGSTKGGTAEFSGKPHGLREAYTAGISTLQFRQPLTSSAQLRVNQDYMELTCVTTRSSPCFMS